MGYYKESGKVNIALTLTWGLTLSVIIALAAYGYAFLTSHNPFIYVNFLIAGAYVLIAGVILALIKNLGKIRNFKVVVILAILISLFGLYAIWVSYIAIEFNDSLSFASSNFGRGFGILSRRSISIGRALRSSSLELSGIMLYLIWFIEAAILVGGPLFMVITMGRNDSVYCESCNKWADSEVKYLKKSAQRITKNDIEAKIRSNDLKEFIDLEDAQELSPSYYEFKFTSCGDCKQAHYLSVDEVINFKNDKGKNERKEKSIFPFYELDSHTVPKDVANLVSEA